MDRQPVVAVAATGLELDDGRIISVAVTEAARRYDTAAEAQAADRELGRVLRMYQPELARQYIDGYEQTRTATHGAFRATSRADPHAVEAFAQSVLECPDAVTQDRGPGVVSGLLKPNLPALLEAYETKLGAGVEGARRAVAATVGASLAAYNSLAEAQGRPTLPDLDDLIEPH